MAPVPVSPTSLAIECSSEEEACTPQPPMLVRRDPLECFAPRSVAIKGPVSSVPKLAPELPPTAMPSLARKNLSFNLFQGDRNAGDDLVLPEGFSFSTFLNDESVDLSLPDGMSFSKLLGDIVTDESADAL